MKHGIEAAFDRVNESGGVNGRDAKLVAADDGYEPTRTLNAMKQLYEKDQVFGFIGNIGTATAAIAIPYALEQRALFFGPLHRRQRRASRSAGPLRLQLSCELRGRDRRLVHYLVKLRRLPPRQIAVLAQQDPYGDAGFAGVAKAFRSARRQRRRHSSAFNYPRNTIDVDDAINRFGLQKGSVRAVMMIATTAPPRNSSRRRTMCFPT